MDARNETAEAVGGLSARGEASEPLATVAALDAGLGVLP